jgi:hypothetical protein
MSEVRSGILGALDTALTRLDLEMQRDEGKDEALRRVSAVSHDDASENDVP